MGEKREIPLIDKLKLNAMKDPEELVRLAIFHKNPEVAKMAIDKLMKLDLIHERKAVLACHTAQEANHETVAEHAFNYCLALELPDDTKQRMIRKSIGKIKFESLRKKMSKWLEESK